MHTLQSTSTNSLSIAIQALGDPGYSDVDNRAPQLHPDTQGKQPLTIPPGPLSSDTLVQLSFTAPKGPVATTRIAQADGADQSHAINVDEAHEVTTPLNMELKSDPMSDYVARALEIIPDVEPDHLTALVIKDISVYGPLGVLEHVLHVLLEDSTYPKIENKRRGKRRQSEGENNQSSKRPKVDYAYADISRAFTGGPNYAEVAVRRLQEDFPYIPKAYLNKSLSSLDGRYAPTYISLSEQEDLYEAGKKLKRPVKLPYKRRKIPFRSIKKNSELYDEEFEKERAWVVREVIDSDGECEGGIECGCCFGTYRFQSMVQCPEAHLFCRNCMKAYASNLLGTHDAKINCIDRSGCTTPILESELRRFLPDGMMKLWERVKQRQDIEAAGLGGLAECPFCDYAVIIEDIEDKLLRCGNDDICGVVSCRECKKPNHLPKKCDEVDSVLDGRHAVEEAMSQALFRNCPSCKRAFIKVEGCDSITCPCGVVSCYLCRKPITSHSGSPCVPSVGIKDARDQAIRGYIRHHPEVDAKDIQVSLSVNRRKAGPRKKA